MPKAPIAKAKAPVSKSVPPPAAAPKAPIAKAKAPVSKSVAVPKAALISMKRVRAESTRDQYVAITHSPKYASKTFKYGGKRPKYASREEAREAADEWLAMQD